VIKIPLWGWNLVAAFWLLGFLSSCAQLPQQKVDTSIPYKRDMMLTVNGEQFEGVMVARKAAKYAMRIQARGTLDLFTFETCHREIAKPDAGKSGLFGDRRQQDETYVPVPGLEDVDSCPVKLGGYERDGGRTSWGIVDFEDDRHTLAAEVKCNGEHYGANGVSICQSKKGLLQEIIFPVEVIYSPDPKQPACSLLGIPTDGKRFRFKMPSGECVHAFLEDGPKRRQHRLTTFGYEAILIREK
jgi:hypothetical protein